MREWKEVLAAVALTLAVLWVAVKAVDGRTAGPASPASGAARATARP